MDVGGIYANSTEGGAGPISGSHASGGLVLTYVDPGHWWVTAYDAGMTACDMSEVAELAAGGRLDWTASAFPGTLTEDSGCVLPQ